jgi:hypothetical protein
LVREFDEPLVRSEFAYVAENLLLRAGYRKTHFQADQTTLQSVSQMGQLARSVPELLTYPQHSSFTPLFARHQKEKEVPFIFPFQEVILQAAIRQRLHETENLAQFLSKLQIGGEAGEYEVLGEKALSQGHVDILIKDRVPIARARKLVVEVKRGKDRSPDLLQVRNYMDEFGKECVGGVLIADGFPKRVVRDSPALGIRLFRHSMAAPWTSPITFDDLKERLRLDAEV